MFNKRLLILKIDKKDIVAGLVTDLENPSITDLQTFPWVEKTLNLTLKDIHSQYNTDHVRILLRESVAHVFSFAVDEKEIHSRALIKEHLAAQIPEKIEQVAWDYKVIDNFIVEDEDVIKKVVQVIATDKQFISTFHKALKDTNFKVEATVPVSTTLARMTQDELQPFSLIHIDNKATRMILFRGIVLASQVADTETLGGNLNQLSSYTFNHFSIKPKKIILSNAHDSIDPDILKTDNLEISKENFDPMIGIVTKTDLKGEDEDVLNIESDNKEQEKEELKPVAQLTHSDETMAETEEIIEPETTTEGSSKTKVIILSIISILILTGLGVGAFFIINNTNINDSFTLFHKQSKPTSTPVPATPEPTPSISQEDISLMILNGNGAPGIASEYEDMIKDAGYKRIEKDNADSYDYEGITIRLKEDKQAYYELIKKDLEEQTDLEATQGADLKDDFDTDAVVIIGQ